MAFEDNAIHIHPEAWNSLETMLINPKYFKFDSLFTHFKNDGLVKISWKDGPNRYIYHNDKSMTLVAEWNDICSSIDELLHKGGFPKNMSPMRQDYSGQTSNTTSGTF